MNPFHAGAVGGLEELMRGAGAECRHAAYQGLLKSLINLPQYHLTSKALLAALTCLGSELGSH